MNYAEREQRLLAPYAMHATESAGRAVDEAEHAYRSPYQRDRDRITHSSAFRRLSHKTQVFTRELGQQGGDYHRSRLTHTLEVASIARTIARALRLNEDLVEALALAHDVGHPPFGHAGEAVLDERLKEVGGFNHNRQAVRLFTKLERRYPDRAGLNLTAEVLDGQRIRGEKASCGTRQGQATPLLEVQVVDAADSIAYDAHDADDALEMGLLSLEDLDGVSLWRESVQRVRERYANVEPDDLRRATVHELLDRQVSDLLGVASARIESLGIDSVAAVRAAGKLTEHSPEFAGQRTELESFLFRRVYRHPVVLEHRAEATAALGERYENWIMKPESLPTEFAQLLAEEPPARVVADYLASQTDRAILRGVGGAD